MSDINLYVRFVREDGEPRPGKLMQFAVVSFGGATLTGEQQRKFTDRFEALPSCATIEFCGTGSDYRAIIDSVRCGNAVEGNFISEVEACARRHYTVKRVTRPSNNG